MKLTKVAVCLLLLVGLSSCYDRPREVEQALVQAKSLPIPQGAQSARNVAKRGPASQAVEGERAAQAERAGADQHDGAGAKAASPSASDGNTNGTPSQTTADVNDGLPSEAKGEPSDAEGPEHAPVAEDAGSARDSEHPEHEADGAAPEAGAEAAVEKPTHEVDWASYITVDELRQEINFMLEQMSTKIATRRDFDRYYKELQGDASVLGVLGVILQQHPDAGKLKRVGAAIAEASIDLAIATEERSAASYAETKEVLERVRQAITSGSASADVEPVEWEDVADLVALMRRMDVAYRRLRGAINSPTFTKDAYELAHEARLLAILAKVSSYYRDNEPGYVRYAGMLERAALSTAQASMEKNVDAARKSVSEIGRVCNECHRAFRLERGTGNTLDF